ncbi:Ig-like domain-containing protein, partial [Parapedobacter pyrenivorans]|uniref:Ig-like domain-containing protein n=1 Tax=Parapedobacter pyrenivorans TaxID=1305674 RepID=UPI0033428583
MLILFVIPTALRAQVRNDFEPKYKSPTAIRGNFAMLGNTVVELADNPYGGKVSHNGDGVKFVDVDNDVATINSSAATLVFSNENGAVNSCTQILYAGLYWTGRSSSENNFVDAVLPDGSTIENRFQKDKIKFKKDGSAYEEFTADGVLIPEGDPNDVDNNRGMYVAYADITDYVTSHRDGIYYAADIATTATSDIGGLGIGYFGGWGLVVVYENPLMKTRHVIVYDGYAFVRGANSPENNFEIEIDEFQSIKSGPVNFTLGVMAGEGDKVDLGDYFGMMNRSTNSYERLQHENSDVNNFFNSSIVTQGQRWPELEDNAGLDIATFDVANDNNKFIGNNQTTTSFEYGTNGDNYVIFNLTFAVDAYEPEVHPLNSLITPIPPSGTFAPGATVDFLLEVRNTGSEEVVDGRIEIPIPNTVTMQVSNVSQGQTNIVDNVLVWEIGDLMLPDNQLDVVATMEYSVTIDDCVQIQSDDCNPQVSLNGNLSGKGKLTGEELDVSFIKAYLDGDDECDVTGVPVFGGVDFDIDLSGCFKFTGADDLEVCVDEEVEVVFSDELGTIAEYNWSIDNTEIGLDGAGQGSLNFVAINATDQIQTATVTVVPVSLSGCEGTPVLFTITVYPAPNAIFEGGDELCPGSTTLMQAEQSGGTWSSSDESVATVDANGRVTAIAPGTVEINYAVVNDNACEATYSKTITVKDDCLVMSEKEVSDQSGDQLAQAGEELRYTIRLTSSFDRVVDRTITDVIPLNTTFIEGSITNNGVYDAATNSITWINVAVPVGGEITVSFAVKVNDNLTDIAEIVNIAKVTGEDPETPEEPEVEIPTDPTKSFTSTKAADKVSVKAG